MHDWDQDQNSMAQGLDKEMAELGLLLQSITVSETHTQPREVKEWFLQEGDADLSWILKE